MATREKRLAEFNGAGEPPPDQPVQVLCEDHSGTYQLPFACRFVDGAWRNPSELVADRLFCSWVADKLPKRQSRKEYQRGKCDEGLGSHARLLVQRRGILPHLAP